MPSPWSALRRATCFIVCAEIDAGVAPHGNGKDDVPNENERLDPDLGQNPHDYRCQSHDDECTGPENQSCVGSSVAVQALEHLKGINTVDPNRANPKRK